MANQPESWLTEAVGGCLVGILAFKMKSPDLWNYDRTFPGWTSRILSFPPTGKPANAVDDKADFKSFQRRW